MLLRIALAVVLLSILSVAQAGTFDRPVINLDAKTFDNEVLEEDRMSMVVFYAPWCGHCKTLGPEFQKAAGSLAPIVPFYAVDCDDAANRNLCAKYEVKGFPTIKAFTRGGRIPPRDYTGERQAGSLTTYASHAVADRVKKLKFPAKGGLEPAVARKQIETFLSQDPAKPHVLLIHPIAASVPLLYKALSQRFSSQALGYIRDADAVIKETLGFDAGEPGKARLLTWKTGSSVDEYEVYQGALKYDALATFLSGGPVVPHPSGTTASPSSSTAAAPDASALKRADERTKAQKRWEEEERRDQSRRAKLAAKRAAAAEDASAAIHDGQETTTTEGTAAEPEEAKAPTPPTEGSAGQSASKAADPSPEASSAPFETHQRDEL